MKKILLFALPLLAMIAVSCEKDNGELSGDDIIEFKDPNFLKALLTVQEIEIYDVAQGESVSYVVDVDSNKDGKISVTEAKGVKGLALIDYEDHEPFGVKEMPEIKYFTSLTDLDCGGNPLETLDVSQNVALTRLVCTDNQLTSLDVSNNLALESLDCGDNPIVSLDLSNNTALKELRCYYNELTALNISENAALTSLECAGNKLTILDLSKNPVLAELGCRDNQLTKVILQRNNVLDDDSIQSIIDEYGNIIEYL